MHKFYTSDNFRGALIENKGVFMCEMDDYEEVVEKIMDDLLS